MKPDSGHGAPVLHWGKWERSVAPGGVAETERGIPGALCKPDPLRGRVNRRCLWGCCSEEQKPLGKNPGELAGTKSLVLRSKWECLNRAELSDPCHHLARL